MLLKLHLLKHVNATIANVTFATGKLANATFAQAKIANATFAKAKFGS